jgi:hypothetical protein
MTAIRPLKYYGKMECRIPADKEKESRQFQRKVVFVMKFDREAGRYVCMMG